MITTRIFDPNTGTLESEQSGAGSSASLENKTYSWDHLGNLQSRADALHGTTEAFTYDDLNRLTQAALNGTNVTAPALTLAYDSVGNITCKSDVVGSACAPGSTAYRCPSGP